MPFARSRPSPVELDPEPTTKFVRRPARHTPPKARTTGESALPTVMVAPEAWSGQTCRILKGAIVTASEGTSSSRADATHILRRRSLPPGAPLKVDGGGRAAHRASIAFGGVALGVGLALLYFFPLIRALVDGALAAVR
jgi:hypothetical protein